MVQGKRVGGGKSGVGREKEIQSAQRERGDTEGYSQERQERDREKGEDSVESLERCIFD